jgi:hypothetical protein
MIWLLKALSVIRSVTGYIIELFTRYPLQFILVLVCCYAFWQKTRYDAIVSDYEAYVTSVQLQADKQKAKNEILRKQAETSVKQLTENHTKQLEAVKHEYEKRNKTNNITIAALRSELRDQIAADSFRVPKIDTNTARTAEEWRNSYTAISNQYQTLIDACTITTLDYNALRGWADTACEQAGCD